MYIVCKLGRQEHIGKVLQGTEWLFLDYKKYTPLPLNINARMENGIFSAVESI